MNEVRIINANINFKLEDYGTKITRSLMCCVLFAMSVVVSFAADKLMIVGDAVWGGWTPANSVVMLPDGENVFKATVYLKR